MCSDERREVSHEFTEGGALDPNPALAKAACMGGGIKADGGALVGGSQERARGKAARCDVSDVSDTAKDVGKDPHRERVERVAGL